LVALIKNKQDAIIEVCLEHGVVRLDVFGSALREDYRPHGSDIDLLVEFSDRDPYALAQACFDMLDDLSALLGTKQLLYAAWSARLSRRHRRLLRCHRRDAGGPVGARIIRRSRRGTATSWLKGANVILIIGLVPAIATTRQVFDLRHEGVEGGCVRLHAARRVRSRNRLVRDRVAREISLRVASA
jgi:predicted nucleotidyltransferase